MRWICGGIPTMSVERWMISPTGAAFTTMVANECYPIAVAYPGSDYRSLSYGFPLDMITDPKLRRAIINASYQFLCNTK